MAKYIEREALIEWLKRIKLIDLSDGHGLCRVIMEDDFKKAIKKIPKGIIADVATVRHGRWIPAVHVGDCCYRCSECQFLWDAYLLDIGNYCPNCGARMDEEENNAKPM